MTSLLACAPPRRHFFLLPNDALGGVLVEAAVGAHLVEEHLNGLLVVLAGGRLVEEVEALERGLATVDPTLVLLLDPTDDAPLACCKER